MDRGLCGDQGDPRCVARAGNHRRRGLDVSDYTLELFKAPSKSEFLARLGDVFRGDMRAHFAAELIQMWSGNLSHQTEGVNYALDGTPVDILLSRCALPGHEDIWSRVLVSIVDISERKRADRARLESEAYANGLFEHSPISLWVEDYTGIRRMSVSLRAEIVTDLARHLRLHPEFVNKCIASINVIDEMQRVRKLIEVNNQFYHGPPLSIAMGAGTIRDWRAFGSAYKAADDAMYADKGLGGGCDLAVDGVASSERCQRSATW